MVETFLDGRVTLLRGDCLERLRDVEESSVDSCVTDPPYGLKFMQKAWDHGVPGMVFWSGVLRVLKPGAHLLAFSGTRTYHRMACAIEDAGFEVRDCIFWCYGSGFPKSHNVSNGWGTALKPAIEPICFVRKPLSESSIAQNVLKHGTGAMNIDGCRIAAPDAKEHFCANAQSRHIGIYNGGKVSEPEPRLTSATLKGRWPANLIHDGSVEVLERFPDSTSTGTAGSGISSIYGEFERKTKGTAIGFSDNGSAARFFYTAKADSDDRLGSKHPTIKPVDLMQYLVRLVTPKNGMVLDPFAGTGTTGEAAWREGMRCTLVEREHEYQADIVKRMKLCLAGPDERRANSVKQDDSLQGLSLFEDR